MSTLRWKVITVVAVMLIFGTVGVFPIVASRLGLPLPQWLRDRGLKLGLDLKGGVHLVLRVQTDDALSLETLTEMERLRELLSTNSISAGNIRRRVRPSSRSKASRTRRTPLFGSPRLKSKRTSIAAPASAVPTPSR